MKTDSKGLGAVVIIIVVLVVAAVAGAGFFVLKRGGKVLTNAATTVVTSAETQKALDDCKKEFNDDDLCKALSNFIGSKQYQTTATMNGLTMSMEIDGTKTYTKQAIGGKTLEQVISGDTTYTKDNTDGKWWKQVAQKTSSTNDYKFDTNIENTTTKTTYTKVGQESCDKLTCNKYKITESGSTDVQYIWIDTKDHLIRKWTMESKDGKYTANYSYNKKSVDTPSSTKDASATQNVIPSDFTSAMVGAMGSGTEDNKNGSSNKNESSGSSSSGSSNNQNTMSNDTGSSEVETDN